ncbi:hypothetical protein [Providencia sp. PROV064]|nr:hypothetical protein [Providencia sp. PROV064]
MSHGSIYQQQDSSIHHYPIDDMILLYRRFTVITSLLLSPTLHL